MGRVVVLGSTNTDMAVRLTALPAPGQTCLGGAFAESPGGKGANQAVAARRAGAEVVFLTAVGDDDRGRRALERYRAEGIDVAHVRVVEGEATGVALLFVAESGENMIGVAPGANLRLVPGDIDRLPDAVFAPGGVFLASLEVPLEAVAVGLRQAKRSRMTTVLNPAPAPSPAEGLALLEWVDVLTPNRAEAFLLAGLPPSEDPDETERAIAILLSAGAGLVVVTLGGEGCLVAGPSGAHRMPAFRVRAVDTVGAGDAFSGVLASALAGGDDVGVAVRRASAAAALTVTSPGAQSALPDHAAIDRLLDSAEAGAGPFPPPPC